jgi:hypothetical protein
MHKYRLIGTGILKLVILASISDFSINLAVILALKRNMIKK